MLQLGCRKNDKSQNASLDFMPVQSKLECVNRNCLTFLGPGGNPIKEI